MADKPNVNPTPRQEFQANAKFLSMHRDMMQMPMLSISIQYAMMQFNRLLADRGTVDGSTAAATFYKLQGAHEFLAILKSLAEMPEIIKFPTTTSKLDYKQ